MVVITCKDKSGHLCLPEKVLVEIAVKRKFPRRNRKDRVFLIHSHHAFILSTADKVEPSESLPEEFKTSFLKDGVKKRFFVGGIKCIQTSE